MRLNYKPKLLQDTIFTSCLLILLLDPLSSHLQQPCNIHTTKAKLQGKMSPIFFL